jgi:hypothetical protein
VINSLTGRGEVPKLSPSGSKFINATMFSIRFLKSQIDVLTQPFNPNYTPYARKIAATNLLRIVGGIATINLIANLLYPGSVEKDPRSTGFGKIKIGNTRIDTTGGLASLITLASRIIPTVHNGKLGFWSKNPNTGEFSDLTAGKYGQTTALDVFENFWEGRLSPMAGLLRDVWTGHNFNQEKVTFSNAIGNGMLPLSVQQFNQIMDGPDSDKILSLMILEGLGFNTTTMTTQSKPKTSKFK